MSRAVVLVVSEEKDSDDNETVASALEGLGSATRRIGFWDEVPHDLAHDGNSVRALIVECGGRPDLAGAVLKRLRADSALENVKALLAIGERFVPSMDPAMGYDDFIVAPYFTTELYARIRTLEWRGSEFATDERVKFGQIVIDVAGRSVMLDGRAIELTAKEFALLLHLVKNRGRAFTRETLLARVWGRDYEGGARTVDIHVRRLRAKLGAAFTLSTVRGTGYKLDSQ